MPKDPRFKSYLEESDYWDTIPLDELIKTSEPVDAKFIDARPKKAVSLRLTESLIAEGKGVASEMGLGYQTLFRIWITEGLRRHKLQRLEERVARKRKTA